ncbi:MAG: helix-turn-helix domain-containing protein [Defluviitaleaceae bacterium]|nr:helix-turn-helix domain-containing protein [Defluviitaleaceae bacterium]
MNTLDIILHPARARIIQSLTLGNVQEITTNEICNLLTDMPRTTIYRHINMLIEAKVLQIVSERKIRGSLERTLSLNMQVLEDVGEAEDVPLQAFQFLMLIYAKFERYFEGKPCKSQASINATMFYNNAIMMLTDDEFDGFLYELQDLFHKYHFEERSYRRKPRDISIICAPSKLEES